MNEIFSISKEMARIISIRYYNIDNRPCIDMIYAIMHNFDNIDFRTKM
jgi:hypothetical protein